MLVKNEATVIHTASISGNQKDPACQEEPCESSLQSGDVAKVLGVASCFGHFLNRYT